MSSAKPPITIFRAIYHSRSLMDAAQEYKLLQTCRRNNERLEITGILLYYNRSFIQVLEGTEPRVRALLDRITTTLKALLKEKGLR